MRSYHLVLDDGTERDIKAGDIHTVNGVLEFRNNDTRVTGSQEKGYELVCAYAQGAWRSVEVERLDDKG